MKCLSMILFIVPDELYLIEDTTHFGAGEMVSFELVQLAVSTSYTFNSHYCISYRVGN